MSQAKRVLVTGAAGMLGSQVLLSAPDDVKTVGTDLVAAAGVPLEKVTLHGNYKKDEDLEAALELGVGLGAIDSVDE